MIDDDMTGRVPDESEKDRTFLPLMTEMIRIKRDDEWKAGVRLQDLRRLRTSMEQRKTAHTRSTNHDDRRRVDGESRKLGQSPGFTKLLGGGFCRCRRRRHSGPSGRAPDGARDTPPIFDGVPRVRDTEKDKTPLSLIIS